MIYIAKGLGEFQPVFKKGSTRADLDRRLGGLTEPRDVAVGGFDWRSPVINGLANSTVVKECPGRPFIMAAIDLASKVIQPPPPPDPAQP